MVFNDLLETLGITVFSGIYYVHLAIHLITVTTVIADSYLVLTMWCEIF